MKKITIDGEVYVLEKDVLRNTGDKNTGDWNTGDRNTGNRNTGYWNTGYGNTGNRNTGYWNTGYGNTGDVNTGYGNTGDVNTGNRNTGDWNTGNRNTGDWNTGYWNTGNWNTGFLNTNESTVRMFNKDTGLYRNDIKFPNYFYFDVPTTKWIEEGNMTDEEKESYPSYETTGGYLKYYEVDKTLKTYWKKAFNDAPIEEVKQTLQLPNFDYCIFEEITGISKADFDERLGGIIEVEGVRYKRID